MNNQERSHTAASVLGLLVMPGVYMLIAAAIGGALNQPPKIILLVVLSIGLMWHGLARQWLRRYGPADDRRLVNRCLLTLFVAFPGAILLIFGVVILGNRDLAWLALGAPLLGILPLYQFYVGELTS